MTDVVDAVVDGVHDLDRRRAAGHAIRLTAAYVLAHTAALVLLLALIVPSWLSLREVGRLFLAEPMLFLDLYRPTLLLTEPQSYGEVAVLVALYVGAVVVAYGPRRIWRARP